MRPHAFQVDPEFVGKPRRNDHLREHDFVLIRQRLPVAFFFIESNTPLDGGSFTISYDLSGPDTSYAAFYIGGADLTVRPLISANTDFGFLISPTGSSTWKSGSSTGTATVPLGLKSYEFTVTTDDFNNGTVFTIDLLINGVTYDLNGAGPDTSLSGLWSGGPTVAGFSTRSNFNDRFTFVDNFTVTAIPEPSTLLLVLIPAFSFYLLRRRKA